MFNARLKYLIAACLLVPGTASVTEQEEVPDVYLELTKLFPTIKVEDIGPAPVEGLLEIRFDTEVFYVSADGRFLIRGDIFDSATKENLTEQLRTAARLERLAQVDETSMLVFEPDDAKYTITVFTDIDCPYCRKFHREMEELNAKGIRVRYMFFPRAGPGSESWDKAIAVWCSDDRKEALTRAKLGADLGSKECGTTPVAQHYEVGKIIGIQGTPAIMTESGELIGGYMPVDALEEELALLNYP